MDKHVRLLVRRAVIDTKWLRPGTACLGVTRHPLREVPNHDLGSGFAAPEDKMSVYFWDV